MNKKQERTLLIVGGLAAAGLVAWYLYNQSQTSAASAAAAAATVPGASTTTSSAAVPVVTQVAANTDPTQAGAMVFNIDYVVADNQAGAYNVQFQLSITNNTSIAQTLQSVSGQAFFYAVAAPFANASLPAPYTGLLGNVSDNTTVTIPAGGTVSKLYVVNVPINAGTNFYVAQLAWIDAAPGPRVDPFVFIGNINVSGDTIPVTIKDII